MNKNGCEAAESIADSFLRMACVNCNFADALGKRTSDSPTYLRKVATIKKDIRTKTLLPLISGSTVTVAG